MQEPPSELDDPVLKHARSDAPVLRQDMTVDEALAFIRQTGVGERIVYFYVLDGEDRLAGVLPTRRLLISPLDRRLTELMIDRVIAIPAAATLLEACEFFALYRYLAFPVVDEEKRLLGIIDAQVFTEEVFDFAERDRADELFEEIGFRVREVRDAPPARAFRFRFPWLLATVASGAACAFIVTAFQATLARAMVLASFLALALALAESVSIQSMTIALQALHSRKASWRTFLPQVRREGLTAVLIAAACGAITFLLVWAVQRAAEPAFAIGASVAIAVVGACLYGLVVPTVLHRFRLEPKIAAGPLALALTDVTTLLVYFTLGSLVL